MDLRAKWLTAAMMVVAMAIWTGCGPDKKVTDKKGPEKHDHEHAGHEHPPHGENTCPARSTVERSADRCTPSGSSRADCSAAE